MKMVILTLVVYVIIMSWFIYMSISGLKRISELRSTKADRIFRFLIKNRATKLKLISSK